MASNDPLTSATRANKRNLLVTSVLAISANAFKVSIDKIPVAGLSITFDERLFAFLLLVTLSYFLCTFSLYYFIDIKNIEKTIHQERSGKDHAGRKYIFAQRYEQHMLVKLRELLPAGYGVTSDMEFRNYLLDGTAGAYPVTIIRPRGVPEKEIAPLVAPFRAAEAALIAAYKRAEMFDKIRSSLKFRAVEVLYVTRNYFVDGALPIAVGLLGLAALLGLVDLHWLQALLPKFRSI